MLDAAPPDNMQRSKGAASVTLAQRGGMTRLTLLAQSGSAKAFLPRCHTSTPEIVFLNTSGGLTGGDRLDYTVTLGANCRATATTQTAERAYASTSGEAEARVTLTVADGAHLDWLPQETILFNASTLSRKTTVDLAETASCLFLETVVLGRQAMGETLRNVTFSDHRTIRRNGRPIWVEPLRMSDDTLLRTVSPTLLGGALCLSTIVYVSPDAEARLSKLRALPAPPGVESAMSAFDGKLILRALAPDSWQMRCFIASALGALRPDPLPRVWQL